MMNDFIKPLPENAQAKGKQIWKALVNKTNKPMNLTPKS